MCKESAINQVEDAADKDRAAVVRMISRKEIKTHNSPSSAWCTYKQSVLDITSFAERHPGGDMILLAAGSDATVLIETYHPRGIPSSLIQKLTVGEVEDKMESYYSWDSDFYPTLKSRVVKRLEELQLSRRGGSGSIFIKALGLIAVFWFGLYSMYMAKSLQSGLIWCVVVGTAAAFVGTCIQHDGSHGAFSNHKWINKLAGWTQDMIGASAFTWELQHMLGHHPYTNVINCKDEDRKQHYSSQDELLKHEFDQENDPDVFSSFPVMRMHPYHKAEWYHRYQHIYAPLLFCFMTMAKVFQQDYEVILQNRLYHIDANCRYGSILNKIRFWSMKAISMIYMVCLPCYFQGPLKGIIFFVLAHMVCGSLLATMFIVNHVIEGVAFGYKDGGSSVSSDRPITTSGKTPMKSTIKDFLSSEEKEKTAIPLNDWAAVQCQTSVNWSAGSWFWNHFSGGLSHQIEHHLFPSICHTNYVHIQDVVKSTCEEFGVPYQSEQNLLTAYRKMLSHLYYLGNNIDKLKST